jgi:tetratricopeptide (TPR) repeat protein
MTAVARTFARGLFEACLHRARRLSLVLFRWAGSLYRRATRGLGPLLLWPALAALILMVLVPESGMGRGWGITQVLLVAGALLVVRWLAQARKRVVIQEFVDYTTKDEQAVKGLGTLLVAELSRLHDLYGRVNDQLSSPLSVGVQHRGGTGAGGEPGAFLSVRADDLTGTLDDAIATEAKVQFAGVTIPIGFVFSIVGRIARGPRIMGSLHYTDAVGGPTLTAQLVGGAKGHQWRVETGGQKVGKAFLEPMVTELAARMFNDLTLRSSVRWRSIRSFTEYLSLYWESHRTPRDRGANLKLAEGKLLEAIAEDETFDLAYYNLGVIYSQLAETERMAAQASDYVGRGDSPEAAYRARIDAALAAFNRAVAVNRDRSEAIYALAVHEYAGGGEDDLQGIVCRCDRVLELDRHHAQAYDLRGMALRKLRHWRPAERSHRRAVALSWRELRRAEFTERAIPPTTESLVPGARANTAAALHNLADVHLDCAAVGDSRRVRLRRANALFGRAAELAPASNRAATLLARGRMREDLGRLDSARDCYQDALRIDPENPVYWARMASVAAAAGRREEATQRAAAALGELAPVYRRTLEAHRPRAGVEMVENTLDALVTAYESLRDEAATARVAGIRRLADDLEEATKARDVAALKRLKAENERPWEREQVQIALARTFGRRHRWRAAAREYGELIAMLAERRPQGIVQHSLHAKHARALRQTGKLHAALATAARGQLQDPLSASARREVGKAHFALLQYEEALDAWRHTLWLTPNDPHLHFKVAFCHWSVAQDRRDAAARRASLEAAASCFDQAAMLFGVEGVKGWAWSQLWEGRVRTELGDHDAAVRHLRSATACAETEPAARLLLGEAYGATGDHALSRSQLDKARALAGECRGTRHVDEDWGQTLSGSELTLRAEVGLAARDLETGGDHRRALAAAITARVQALELDDPRATERCLALIDDLRERARQAAERDDAAPRLAVAVSR